MRRLRAAKHNNQIDEEKDADSIRRIHFVAHGCRKGSLTHITTTALERKKISEYPPRPFCCSWTKKRVCDTCYYCITSITCITCITCTWRKMIRLPFYTM